MTKVTNNIIANSQINFGADINPSAPLAKPIEKVQQITETVADSIITTKDEKRKKLRRNIIAAGSSVLVLSGLVMLLNPKVSPKIVGKLKNLQSEAEKKVKTTRNNKFVNKFHKASQNIYTTALKVTDFISNGNSLKDIEFKWLCTEKKDFLNVRNKPARKALSTFDKGFRTVFKKPHECITNWFDNISKNTVKFKYNQAAKKMNNFESLVSEYSSRLTAEQKKELNLKLSKMQSLQEYFSESNLNIRLKEQENLMQNLERDFLKKFNKYRKGFSNNFVNKSEHINKNLSFWAQDIIEPKRKIIEDEGNKAVNSLVGNENGQKGVCNEIVEFLTPYLHEDEIARINKSAGAVKKQLENANHCECVEYFSKKRDLTLGSAPTDIVTALISLIMSGVVIGTADTKDERISKCLTGVFPIVSGVGANLAFTAMLLSGPKSMLLGTGASALLSGIGHIVNNKIFGENNNDNEKETDNA
jgi:hypothetical protein